MCCNKYLALMLRTSLSSVQCGNTPKDPDEGHATHELSGVSREKPCNPAPNHQQVNPWCECLMTVADRHR